MTHPFLQFIKPRERVAPASATPPDPHARIKAAVDELNAAWAANPSGPRPWVVWTDREVVLIKPTAPVVFYSSKEGADRG